MNNFKNGAKKYVFLIAQKAVDLELRLFGLNTGVIQKDSEYHFAKKGMRILAYGCFSFFIWAAFFPLDKGVPASGAVVSEGNHKLIQHISGGIVEDIFVKEGDRVKKGQLLIKINPTQTLGQVNATNESILGVDAQNQRLSLSMDAKKEQLKILQAQVVALKKMESEGYIAKNKVMDVQRDLLRVQDALEGDNGSFERNLAQIAELKQRLGIQNYDLSNTEIKAPNDGTVVNLAVFTKGGVITPGSRLLEIITSDDPLVIEAQLPTQLIDKVYPGLEVEIMFSAFNQNKTPKLFGTLTTISADRLTDERSGFPYYKIRAQVTPDSLKKLLKFNIRPGMPVEVFVKTGERSLLNYIFKPVLDRTHSALREE
jgi:protease secretion system membrane fusion protein